MTNKELLIKEIEKISDTNVQEVLDFVYFIKQKREKDIFDETVLLSESALEKDWLKPEEEEAWQNL